MLGPFKASETPTTSAFSTHPRSGGCSDAYQRMRKVCGLPSESSGVVTLTQAPSHTTGLRNETLHIRIAGVDAPEAAHFGRPVCAQCRLRQAETGRTF